MGSVHLDHQQLDEAVVARVIIDRVDKLNALDTPMVEKLASVFQSLSGDDAIRAVVLEGAGGKAWVGGADIKEMAALSSPRMAAVFIHRLHLAMLTIRDLPVPVIAKIDGYSLGAGMELAAACDMRIASDAAHFGMPEVQVGLPSVIEASLLPGLMGRGRAARLVLTGEIIDAARAFEWGFVEEVAPQSELDDAVNRILQDICNAGPNAVRSQKQLLRHWERVDPDTAAIDSIKTFGEAFETDEPKTRLGRFSAKSD
jgi:enoyl-CoA hydratase